MSWHYAGRYHGVRLYETDRLGRGYNSAGLALPGIGIFIGEGTYSEACDEQLVQHEYGHFLQARSIGYIAFYLCVGIPSLLSAWTRGYGRGHQCYWTEGWANELSRSYFEGRWPEYRFPCEDITARRLRWIKWRV